MKILAQSIIYDNPMPHLRSRHSAFPFLCECDDGTLVAAHSLREAFESVDGSSNCSFSYDGGKTWSDPIFIKKPVHNGRNFSNSCKITNCGDGKLVGIGYGFYRDNPELPLGNAQTGGLLDDEVFYVISEDNGKTWSEIQSIQCLWGPHVEASAPITVLQDGAWVTPITGFPAWDGTMTGPVCGRVLRSEDQGKTWNDDAVCMEFDEPVLCYEQRMCQLESGTLVCIAWNENMKTGERLDNHYTYSVDNGKTWSKPISTGIRGQASFVGAIGGEKLIALHAIRRDTDRPGIYAYVIDFSDKTWKIVDEALLWEPNAPILRDKNMAEVFAFLKFGQPSAIKLKDGNLMMCHWFAENGQYKTIATRIEL